MMTMKIVFKTGAVLHCSVCAPGCENVPGLKQKSTYRQFPVLATSPNPPEVFE